jgi:hypothetical protein
MTVSARDSLNERVGFLDPGAINCDVLTRWGPDQLKEAEQYTLDALVKLQDKDFILLPYNFKYVFHFLEI